jgi:hypothetical protein
MTDTNIAQGAAHWASRGWRVHPLRGKVPMLPAWQHEATTDPAVIDEWWGSSGWPDANVGGMPPAGCVVIDIDAGAEELDWPDTYEHRTGSGGRHLLYSDPQGIVDQKTYWPHIDVRTASKGQIVLPPSVHPVTGARYTVAHDREVAIFPYHLLPAQLEKGKPAGRGTRAGETLADLLAVATADPADPALGDEWMVRVAGHLARLCKHENDWWAALLLVNGALDDPLGDKAMAKKRGIWYKEHQKPEYNTDENQGWLFEGGHGGYSSLVESGSGKLEAMAWSDFRVSTRGVMYDAEERIDAWLIDLHLSDGSTMAGVRLPSAVLASTASLRKWLMAYGCTLHTTTKDPRTQAGERLMKLMQSQQPTRVKVTDHFGWSPESGSFITPAGSISTDGLSAYDTVWPHPNAAEFNEAKYGMVPPEEAVEALRQVLTFQDELATSIMGSWLVMLLLRGQWAGLMPGLLVEAYSESGKTTFLQLLCQLAGQPQGGGSWTTPVARDHLSANASGILLLDDFKLDEGLQELVRNAVTNGEAKKKTGSNYEKTGRYKLRGGIILSGEGMDFAKQKANRDRFIRVELGKATDRRRADGQPQWLDVQVLMAKYGGDLSAVAGGLVQAVLGRASGLSRLPGLLSESGRASQGAAVVRCGARILDELLGSGTAHADRVDLWATGRAGADTQASVVTLELIPTAWRRNHQPASAETNPPVFRDGDGNWWVHSGQLVDFAKQECRFDERMKSLTTATAINRELAAIGAEPGQIQNIGVDSGHRRQARYWRMPSKYNTQLLDLAMGGSTG